MTMRSCSSNGAKLAIARSLRQPLARWRPDTLCERCGSMADLHALRMTRCLEPEFAGENFTDLDQIGLIAGVLICLNCLIDLIGRAVLSEVEYLAATCSDAVERLACDFSAQASLNSRPGVQLGTNRKGWN